MVAAAPQVGGVLRPLCRMLGVSLPAALRPARGARRCEVGAALSEQREVRPAVAEPVPDPEEPLADGPGWARFSPPPDDPVPRRFEKPE